MVIVISVLQPVIQKTPPVLRAILRIDVIRCARKYSKPVYSLMETL